MRLFHSQKLRKQIKNCTSTCEIQKKFHEMEDFWDKWQLEAQFFTLYKEKLHKTTIKS